MESATKYSSKLARFESSNRIEKLSNRSNRAQTDYQKNRAYNVVDDKELFADDPTEYDLSMQPNSFDQIQLHKTVRYTDVVVIGNGPSAIALSSFLSGFQPHYNTERPHPNQTLHEKLMADYGESLFDQNLELLAEGLEGRSNNSMSLLYDSLVRPNADIGDENPSSLSWSYKPEKSVRHVVLGKGDVGGTWADFSPEVSTVSFGSWLDLPAYSFREWLEKEGANFATELEMTTDATQEVVGRIPCAAVQQYFKDYVKFMNLERRFVQQAVVNSVQKENELDIGPKGAYCWNVRGTHPGGTFHFRAKKVVLATGASIPKYLNVAKENEPFVFHSAFELEAHIPQLIDAPRTLNPVLVVGDGLSAADAVIRLLIAGIPVVHSFRKASRDTKHILSKLSRAVYPEYHTVFQLMTGAVTDILYKVYPNSEVKCFHTTVDDGDVSSTSSNDILSRGNKVTLKCTNKHTNSNLNNNNMVQDSFIDIEISCAVILIGFKPNLSFFEDDGRRLACNKMKSLDSKTNVVSVDSRCRCIVDDSLYALGPLVGDNFVRYLIGGSMAAAADLCRQFRRV